MLPLSWLVLGALAALSRTLAFYRVSAPQHHDDGFFHICLAMRSLALPATRPAALCALWGAPLYLRDVYLSLSVSRAILLRYTHVFARYLPRMLL